MVDLSNWMEECRQIAEENKDLPGWQRAAQDRERATIPEATKRLEAIEHRLLKIELVLSAIQIGGEPAFDFADRQRAQLTATADLESRQSSATETR